MDFLNLTKRVATTRLFKFCTVLGLCVSSAQAISNELVEFNYHTIINNQLELELVFKDPIFEPGVNLAGNQLELNFFDSQNSLTQSLFEIDQEGVDSVLVEQNMDNMKVLVQMDQVLPYQGFVAGNIYRLTLNDVIENPETVSSKYLNKVNEIDFRRNEEGGGQLLIQLESNSISAEVKQIGAQLEVTLYNSSLPNDLLYVMDVGDFNTPVTSFETFADQLTSKLLIDVNGAYHYDYQQQGNVFLLNIDAVKEDEIVAEASTEYSGKPLSLNFQNIPIRNILQIIADYNNFNLVTSDAVAGNITLRLDNVPWDQALDLILKTKGLDKRIEGDILLIAPAKELAAQEAEQLMLQKDAEELAPLYAKYVQINYAKAVELADLLQGSQSSLLSNRGTVAVDERTNMLLIKDTAESLQNVAELIEVLDVPIRQVLIESRMVTVRDEVAEELGIRWGITDRQNDLGLSGTLEGAESVTNGVVPPLSDRLNVNFPAVNNPATIAFQVAKLSDGTILDLELSALEEENKGEIIASPRITTSNQQSAYIEQGVEIPYVESTSSGATSVTFKKAVLSLTVTPQITPDNRVVLDLVITQDSAGVTVPTSTGEAVAIDTQRIGTQVLVDNGETLVLGGIYQQNLTSRVTKVPLLGDIPYLGSLFRNTSDQNERRELLIFVTPKIVTEAF